MLLFTCFFNRWIWNLCWILGARGKSCL